MSPYLILGVPPNADDSTIRHAYLEAIKKASPETNPELFKVLAAAYEQIKDESCRYRYELFNKNVPGDSPLGAFMLYARTAARSRSMPFQSLKEYLRLCSKI